MGKRKRPGWSDEHVIDAPVDEVRAHLPHIIEDAFGQPLKQAQRGAWRGNIRRGGMRFKVNITARGRGSETVVSATIGAYRTWLKTVALYGLATVTIVAWGWLASLIIVGPQDRTYLLDLIPEALWEAGQLLMVFGPVLVLLMVREWRLDAMSIVEPASKLSESLDAMKAAPRVGGYRSGPRIALATQDEAEAEAEAEASATTGSAA